jgi:RHS repeat-associated protein
MGRRTTRTDGGGTTTTYLYDGENAVQETSGTATRSILTGLGIDERYARDDGGIGARLYFLTDALGSTLALTDAGGSVRQTYSYEPYGEVTASGSSDNPYQYTGRENDGTRLYYYRHRYYSPALKRFISKDPMGLAQGLNEYAYVYGRPLDFNDPEGLGLRENVFCALTILANLFNPPCMPTPQGPTPQTQQPGNPDWEPTGEDKAQEKPKQIKDPCPVEQKPEPPKPPKPQVLKPTMPWWVPRVPIILCVGPTCGDTWQQYYAPQGDMSA